jgi:hypothetical protein
MRSIVGMGVEAALAPGDSEQRRIGYAEYERTVIDGSLHTTFYPGWIGSRSGPAGAVWGAKTGVVEDADRRGRTPRVNVCRLNQAAERRGDDNSYGERRARNIPSHSPVRGIIPLEVGTERSLRLG